MLPCSLEIIGHVPLFPTCDFQNVHAALPKLVLFSLPSKYLPMFLCSLKNFWTCSFILPTPWEGLNIYAFLSTLEAESAIIFRSKCRHFWDL